MTRWGGVSLVSVGAETSVFVRFCALTNKLNLMSFYLANLLELLELVPRIRLELIRPLFTKLRILNPVLNPYLSPQFTYSNSNVKHCSVDQKLITRRGTVQFGAETSLNFNGGKHEIFSASNHWP